MDTVGNEAPQELSGSNATWTLITVTYNSAEKLAEYWASVNWQEGQTWIVVDNNSSDDSVEVARELGAHVIALPENVGFSKANNIGMHASTSEFVGFVNPDVTPQSEDLLSLGDYLREHDVLLSPQLVYPDGSLQPNGRGKPLLVNKILHRLAPNLDTGYRRFASASEIVEVDWLTGAVVLGRRETFDRLGPWNEEYFLYYEDTDLGIRAAQLGFKSVVHGEFRWKHGWARETSSLNLSPWQRELNSLLKFYRHYPYLLLRWPTMFQKKGKASGEDSI